MRLTMLVVTIALMLGAVPAQAAAPANDDVTGAILIEPSRDTVVGGDMSEATLEPGEPLDCAPAPLAQTGSIWYALRPERDQVIGLHHLGSLAPPGVAVYREDQGALTLMACAPRASWTNVSLAGGSAYLLQLTAICPPGCDNPLQPYNRHEVRVGLVPDNDKKQHAAPIGELPFFGQTDLEFATMGADEPTDCTDRSGADFDTADETQTSWYRYEAAVDDVLVGYSNRMFNGVDAGVFRLADDGLDLVTCAGLDTEYDPGDRRPLMFTVEAGRTYLIQLHATDHGPYRSELYLESAPRLDRRIIDLHVDAPGPTRTVSFWSPPNDNWTRFRYDLHACPVSHPNRCSTIAMGVQRSGLPVRVTWYTAGCFGDVVVSARVLPFYDVDPDLSNNIATSTVSFEGGGHGAGAGCPLWPLP